MKLSYRIRSVVSALVLMAIVGSVATDVAAKPVVKSKGGSQSPQIFRRQRNSLSNMDFYFTNRGVLFNNSGSAGLNWPRGTAQSYIFGEGLWFATKKIIGGKRRKLCELGYNPNSGAGWYIEGEWSPTANAVIGDYKSFVSSRYLDDGKWGGGVPDPNTDAWPLWDTAANKTLNRNYYFGDFISDPGQRTSIDLSNGKKTLPAMLSQEDIVNQYTDADVSQNPEYKPNSGYPFYLNITEVIYSWSFGRYRDMIFIRHKVRNASTDTLYECYMAPAFDPDLGEGGNAAGNDHNRYVDYADSTITKRLLKGTCFERDPRRLNMALQYSDPEKGKEYGVIGFAFLESPAVSQSDGEARDLSDSESVGGYDPSNPERIKQLGLATFKKWQIQNDPPTSDLRYDFLSDGSLDGDNANGLDVRLLFSTGPFILPPQKTVETVVGIAIAQASTTDRAKNIDSLFKLMAFAHEVFGGDCYGKSQTIVQGEDTINSTVHTHFASPVPPDIPSMTVTCLDRAMLVEWDNAAELSTDPLSPNTLAFNTYELYRTTRSDFDSTIRPDGQNPVVKLGSWSLFDYTTDSIVVNGEFQGFKKKNTTPNPIPHSFLDIGDDNKDGILGSNEGLLNNVKYYYFLIATDEYDWENNVGPLATAVVAPKNFVTGIPCKPIFPDLPPKITTAEKPCFAGEDMGGTPQVAGIKEVTLEVIDTGKFLQYYANDEILVSFQPRWLEYGQQALDQSPLEMWMDVKDTKTGLNLTYDRFMDPNNTPTVAPYKFVTGLTQDVIGQREDSLVKGKFTTDDPDFTPYQRIDQAFGVLADFEFVQLKDPYKLKGITGIPGGKEGIVRLSQRTLRTLESDPVFNLGNLDETGRNASNPSYLGSLGQVSYNVKFGAQEDMHETEYDTISKTNQVVDKIVDQGSNTEFRPRPMRVTVTSNTHCGQQLAVVREETRNDVAVEFDFRAYTEHDPSPQNPALRFPRFTDPDTMIVPIPGKFTIDAFHYVDDSRDQHSAPIFLMKTSGNYYYPGVTESNGKFHFAIHRLRLAGAEIIMNAADFPDKSVTGDTVAQSGQQHPQDFAENDNFNVDFTGQAKGLPFPGAQFRIPTSPDPVDFNKQSLYAQQEILDQVQVVPNPYIVTHLGQSSTDNAKLFFTRLPPRATIEIYTVSGDLVKTIEHTGYVRNEDGAFNYDLLKDRYNTEEWNILSEGRQRVGSQVLIARVIAKDPKNGDAVLGETRVKFAVVLGGYRQVVRQ